MGNTGELATEARSRPFLTFCNGRLRRAHNDLVRILNASSASESSSAVGAGATMAAEEPSPDSSIDDDDDDDDVMVVPTNDCRVGRNDRDGENAVVTIVRLGRNVNASKRSRGEEMMIHKRDIIFAPAPAPALC